MESIVRINDVDVVCKLVKYPIRLTKITIVICQGKQAQLHQMRSIYYQKYILNTTSMYYSYLVFAEFPVPTMRADQSI